LLQSSKNPQLLRGMERLYSDLDSDIEQLPRRCRRKNACCQFDARSGHRLFVTAVEVCYYLSRRSPPPANGSTCSHLVDASCGARDVRPLGCRIFYCDPSPQDWQGPLTEVYLTRLKNMHEEFGIPYFYADWLTILDAIRDHGHEAAPVVGRDKSISLNVLSLSG